MTPAVLNASALWLQPGSEHPVFRRYSELFCRMFLRYEAFDYRAGYLEAGPEGLEQRVLNILSNTAPDVLIYSQFPSTYSYLRPAFLAAQREHRFVIGMGFDDEIYSAQAKYFYQACSGVISTDIDLADRLTRSGIPACAVVTAWLAHLPAAVAGSGEEDIDVSFVGDMTKPGRRGYVRHLEQNGVKVADYGKGSRNGIITGPEVENIFRRSKINLNFTRTNPPRWILRHDSRQAYSRQIKGRPFELASIGRFCLTEWVPSVEYWFRPGVDIGVFRDADDLVRQVRRYLDDQGLRRRMAGAAMEHYAESLAPEQQFGRAFSTILAGSRRGPPLFERVEPIFWESIGRSRGSAILHALRRGLLMRALREAFMSRGSSVAYWRGLCGGIVDGIAGRLGFI